MATMTSGLPTRVMLKRGRPSPAQKSQIIAIQPSSDLPPVPVCSWGDLTKREASAVLTARAKWRSQHQTDEEKAMSARIRTLKMAMGINDRIFARQLGVSSRSVRRWMNGEGHMPSPASWEIFLKLEDLNRDLLEAKRPTVERLKA